MVRHLFLGLLPVLFVGCVGVDGRGGRAEFVIAFWNVENLFDATDDPGNPGDDDFLPAGEWTEARYRQKLDHLAEVIAAVSPHVLGLAEVENRGVLEDLFAHPRLAGFGYRIVHRDSPDKRGIDLALVHREPFTFTTVALHPFEKDDQLPTRGVLEVGLAAQDRPLTVLVNHWPSRGGDRDGAFRAIAGDVVRGVVDRVGHDADIVVLGDLNDDPFDASVREHLGAVRSRNAVLNRRDPVTMFNPSWSLLAEPDVGTLYYNREWVWNVFDQLIVSRGMLDADGFAWVDGSLAVYAPDQLRDRYRRPLPFRRGRDGTWKEGYSDHFLVHGRIALSAR